MKFVKETRNQMRQVISSLQVYSSAAVCDLAPAFPSCSQWSEKLMSLDGSWFLWELLVAIKSQTQVIAKTLGSSALVMAERWQILCDSHHPLWEQSLELGTHPCPRYPHVAPRVLSPGLHLNPAGLSWVHKHLWIAAPAFLPGNIWQQNFWKCSWSSGVQVSVICLAQLRDQVSLCSPPLQTPQGHEAPTLTEMFIKIELRNNRLEHNVSWSRIFLNWFLSFLCINEKKNQDYTKRTESAEHNKTVLMQQFFLTFKQKISSTV